jgi:hypothetical protein
MACMSVWRDEGDAFKAEQIMLSTALLPPQPAPRP